MRYERVKGQIASIPYVLRLHIFLGLETVASPDAFQHPARRLKLTNQYWLYKA